MISTFLSVDSSPSYSFLLLVQQIKIAITQAKFVIREYETFKKKSREMNTSISDYHTITHQNKLEIIIETADIVKDTR
jgi:hypothetical protein